MSWIIGILIVIAFLFFLLRYPKQTFVCLGVIVALGFLLFYFVIYKPEEDRKQLWAEVEVSITYNMDECPKEYPLLVRISNKSSQTVTKVEWNLEAYRPGFSTNLVDFGSREYSLDKILSPGGAWQTCYRLPPNKASMKDQGKLEYQVSGKYAVFK